jgi:hypothetical protein
MYDLLGPVLTYRFVPLINVMSMNNSAMFQQCSVIFAKSASA